MNEVAGGWGAMDALVAHLGGSEVMLPIQFNGTRGRVVEHAEERRLWLAVFLKVLEDWRVANSPNGRKFPTLGVRMRMRTELTDWFLSDAVTSVPVSFRWLCELFALDSELVRVRLMNGTPLPLVARIQHHGRKTEQLR